MLRYYIAFFHHDEILGSVKGRFLFSSRQTGSRVSLKETKDGSGHTFCLAVSAEMPPAHG